MLTIGEVASRTGLRTSAIRYYEARGLLPAAARKGARRLYPPSILERLAAIELAKAAGFDLEEIRGVLSNAGDARPGPGWRAMAEAKEVEIDGQMRRLATMKAVLARIRGCRCPTFEGCGRAFEAARSELPPDPPMAPAARRRLSAKRLAKGS